MAYLSHTEGAVGRTETISASCELIVVAVIHFDATGAIECELDGTAMDLATDDNDYVKIFYRLNPASGSRLLEFTLTNIQTVVAAQYSDIESFQAAQQASAGSANYSPSGAGLIVHAISATSAGTPVADTNERFDGGTGEWYGDRIVTGAGTVTVGATISDPDYAGAIFLAPSSGQEVDASASFSASSATANVTAELVSEAGAEIEIQSSGARGPSGGAATSSSGNIELADGPDRAVLVATFLEGASGGSSVVTGVTLGGVAMAKALDLNDLVGSDDVANLIWWILLEEDLPANGTPALVVNVSAGRMHGAAWYVLENVSGVLDAVSAFGGSAQTITAADVEAAGFVAAIAYKNNTTAASPTNTIAGNAATLLEAQDQSEGGAHLRVFHALGESGDVDVVWSHSSGNARIALAAISLEPTAVPDEAEEVAASFFSQSASSSVAASRVRDAAAGFAAGAASASVAGDRVVAALAAFAAAAATMAVAGVRVRSGQAAFAAGPADLGLSAERIRPALATFQSASAVVSASASRVRDGSASFSAGASSVAATCSRVRSAAPSFAAAASTAASTSTRVRDALAAFASSSAVAAATATRARDASAAFQAQSAALTASADRVLAGQGAFAAQPADVSVSAARVRDASASFAAQPASADVQGEAEGVAALESAFVASPAGMGVAGDRVVTALTGFAAVPAQSALEAWRVTDSSASFAAASAVLSVALARIGKATATFAAQPSTWLVAGDAEVTATLSAAFAAQPAGAHVSAESEAAPALVGSGARALGSGSALVSALGSGASSVLRSSGQQSASSPSGRQTITWAS